jgi:HYR domain
VTRRLFSLISRRSLITLGLCISLGILFALGVSKGQAPQSQHVYLGSDGRLVYVPYPNGDTIPDFSNAGYGGGGVTLPDVPVVKTITPVDGDDGANIQAAIDEVSALTPNAGGLRGAILLKAGTYEVGGTVRISASGVVLRGEGDGTNGSIIKATGTARRTVIEIAGVGNRAEVADTRQAITDTYLPVGTLTITVANAAGFSAGDDVLVVRTPNQEWIDFVGMDACSTVGTVYDTTDVNNSTCISEDHWTPSARIMRYERKVTAVSGNQITIDAPAVEAFQAEFGGGYVAKYQFPGRIENCGIESLRSESDFASDTDENHAVRMISLANIQNAWVRNVTSVYFEQGTVLVGSGAKYVTVQDSSSLDHKSQITGGRRYPFSLDDCSYVLVMRCYAKTGRHDYVTGSNTPGPNVFLDSRAEQSFSELGPHHRWATGSLFDLIRHESFNGGQIIGTYNRGNSGSGHGWSGAYQLFWNIVGDTHRIASPPGARNWAIGSQAHRRQGDGEFELFGTPVLPSSLYLQQLRDRLGDAALANIGYTSMPPLPGPPRPLPTPTPVPTPTPLPPGFHYEAESIPLATSGPPRVIENDANASNGQWIAFPGGVVDDWIEYTLSDVAAGTYDVVLKYKTHPNRGIHNLSVDGVVIGTPQDQFRTGTSIFPERNFGTVRFSSAGDHVIRLTVVGKNPAAGSFGIAADRFSLVKDVTAPVIVMPGDMTVEATGPNGAVVNFEASATDNKDGPVALTLSHPSGGTFAIGSTQVTATARDFQGNEATANFRITVRDTTAPAIQSLTASPDVIWPPNNRMIPVSLTTQISDVADPAPATIIVSVTSNEPVTAGGWPHPAPDWEITGNLTLNLRAERLGNGKGRIYTIMVESRDLHGNASTKTVTVSVPKSQGEP